jgi:uncharacterized protein (DUF58 family)
MSNSWIRRSFESAGLTQIPPGGHLRALQRRFGGGTVVLMIDVSGSMAGRPIEEAVRGAEAFVKEAVEARYEVGAIIWDVEVVAACRPDSDPGEALSVLRQAYARGGTRLFPPLVHCHQMLNGFEGDRVVAIFGDGLLSPDDKYEALQRVEVMKREDIRFVTRGLGADAARELEEISDEVDESGRVDSVEDLADGIAGMATALRAHPGPGGSGRT